VLRRNLAVLHLTQGTGLYGFAMVIGAAADAMFGTDVVADRTAVPIRARRVLFMGVTLQGDVVGLSSPLRPD